MAINDLAIERIENACKLSKLRKTSASIQAAREKVTMVLQQYSR
jgi:hypothetical protein